MAADHEAADKAAIDRLPGATEPVHFLAARWLLVYRAIGRLAARSVLLRADLLSDFHRDRAHRRSGFASFSDFSREVLQTSPRSAKRQLSLARLTASAPRLRDAFLDGRLSLCKLLALRPLAAAESLPFWIDLADSLTVRELVAMVKNATEQAAMAREGQHSDPAASDTLGNDTLGPDTLGPDTLGNATPRVDTQATEAPATRVTFPAPVPAALVWEHGIRVAQQVLGWKAPRYLCVASILAEAEAALAQEHPSGASPCVDPPGPPPRSFPDPGSFTVHPGGCEPHRERLASTGHAVPESPRGPTRHLAPQEVQAIRQTLALVEREIHSLADLIPTTGTSASSVPIAPAPSAPTSLQASLARYLDLDRLDRRIRLLQALLVRAGWTHHLHRALHCHTLPDFALHYLGLSERAARMMVSEAYLFDDEPRLARPFREGRIGLTQARLIYRVALPSTLDGYLARAQTVTLRQFEREVRFLERLADLAPEIWSDHRGALPDPGLEHALLSGIADRGGDPQAVLDDLHRRGLGDGSPHGAAPPHIQPISDKGAIPDHLSPLDLTHDPAVHPHFMTRLEALLDIFVLQGYPDPRLPGKPTAPPDRQTLAPGNTPPAHDAPFIRWTTLSFLAPPDLLETWNLALHRLRVARGPLPSWACAVLLIQHALDAWLQHDPDSLPTEHLVLERDDYLCQAPGCSSRRQLEVHHIQFRSQGGSDHPGNKITLCHTHHHHVLHEGHLKLTGTAPDALDWKLGTQAGQAPLITLQGERILGKERPLSDKQCFGTGRISGEA